MNIDATSSCPKRLGKKMITGTFSRLVEPPIYVSYLRQHFGYDIKELVRKNGVIAGGNVSVNEEKGSKEKSGQHHK